MPIDELIAPCRRRHNVEIVRQMARELERIVSLEADVQAHRALALEAIHTLCDVTQQRDRLREQHHRLLDEYRHLRAQIMRQAVAA